ncbi:MAG: hypothetical protein AAGM84_10765 [Pseudomonadota bacterium]
MTFARKSLIAAICVTLSTVAVAQAASAKEKIAVFIGHKVNAKCSYRVLAVENRLRELVSQAGFDYVDAGTGTAPGQTALKASVIEDWVTSEVPDAAGYINIIYQSLGMMSFNYLHCSTNMTVNIGKVVDGRAMPGDMVNLSYLYAQRHQMWTDRMLNNMTTFVRSGLNHMK